ncbi:MAG: hypothetical protein Q9227_002821 [Pyrenula ochraceoflavens]
MALFLRLPKLFPGHSQSLQNVAHPSATSATIAEALKSNPFGTRRSIDDFNSKKQQMDMLEELNTNLVTLVRIFPSIKTEVLRELLVRFHGESQLELCVDQLLRYRDKWVQGRWNSPPADPQEPLPLEETFRTESYKTAARDTLALEFKGLNRSAIDAVLAEENNSYARARPVLQEVSKKTWRAAMGNLNIFRKRKEKDHIPGVLLVQSKASQYPIIRKTGNEQLDVELQEIFIQADQQDRKQQQEGGDREYAEMLNQMEAEETGALFECQVCCNDCPFESVATCTTDAHTICFDCIRRTMEEALFGQGWRQFVDSSHGTLNCVAINVGGTCEGHLPTDLTKRAILTTKSGKETWQRFEDRLTSASLLDAGVKLVNCPFCNYAEADPGYHPTSRHEIIWHFKLSLRNLPIVLLLPIFLLLATIFCTLLSLFAITSSPPKIFHETLLHLHHKHRSPLFRCRSPTCSRPSCLTCHKAWHDPHICHEVLLGSLRNTVEAARTAVVKRVCPHCGLAFVKSNGCNKLTCPCGYSMCYVCRQDLSSPRVGSSAAYMHFCGHFRPAGWGSCNECNKCDMYQVNNEEAKVNAAGKRAEQLWRMKMGLVGAEGIGEMPWDIGKAEQGIILGWLCTLWSGGWGWQDVANWVGDTVIKVEA